MELTRLHFVVLMCTVIELALCLQPNPTLESKNRLRNRDQVHDQNHIREHLDGVMDMEQDRMSEEETQFRYFKIHDYDNNNKLDGIELIAALTHYHKEEDPDNQKRLGDDELAKLVETILGEDDRNDDGYIDYSEFMLSQQQ